MVPFALLQTIGQDRHQESFDRAVEKHIRRRLRFEFETDFDAVALIGSDEIASVVERESLLVARLDSFDQIIVGDGEPDSFAAGEQVINRHPASSLECQPQCFGRVTKVLGKELADRGHVAIHRPLLAVAP